MKIFEKKFIEKFETINFTIRGTVSSPLDKARRILTNGVETSSIVKNINHFQGYSRFNIHVTQ